MRNVFVCALSALSVAACSGAEHGPAIAPSATRLTEAPPAARVAQALTECTVAAQDLAAQQVSADGREIVVQRVLGVCRDGKDVMKAAAGPDACLAAADGHYLAALLAWELQDGGVAQVSAQLAQADQAAAACQLALVQA